MLRRINCNSVIMREVIYLLIYSCSDVVLVMYNHLPLIIDDLVPPENSGDLVDLAGNHINLLFPNIVKVANSIPSGFN